MTADPEFELPNVGPGPETVSLAGLAESNDFVVVFFQRDHYCTNCRQQVQSVASRYAEFRERNAAVVSILPEPVDRARAWQDSYELPYPLLADPDATVGERFGQPVRFGLLGNVSDFLGRMPVVVIVDVRTDPRIAWRYDGRSTFDRPTVDDIIAAVDDLITEPR